MFSRRHGATTVRATPTQGTGSEVQKRRRARERYAYQPYGVEYGSGRDPSHYYPGLTPKDVVLFSPKKPMAPAFPRPIRDREVQRVHGVLRTWEQFQRDGRLPHNEDLLMILDQLYYSVHRHAEHVSPDTQHVLNSTMRLVEALETVINEKNFDERFQRLIHHAMLYSKTAMVVYPDQPAFRDVSRSFRIMLRQLVTSRDFRGLLTEGYQIVQELSGGKSQGGMQPMRQQESLWLDGGLVEEMGFEETPRMQSRRVHFEEGTSQGRGYEEYEREEEEEVYAARQGPSRVGEHRPAFQQHPQPTEFYPQQRGYGVEDFQTYPKKFVVESFVEQEMPPRRAPPPMQPPAPTPAYYYPAAPTTFGKDYAAMLRRPFSTDSLYRLMERLRVFLMHVGRLPAFQESMTLMWQMVADLGAVPSAASGDRTHGRTFLEDDANRREMMNDLKALVERFCGYPLDPLIECVDEFQLRYGEDFMLRDFLQDVMQYFSRSVSSYSYLNGPDFVPKGVDLFRKGRELFATQHADVFNAFMGNLDRLVNGFLNDPVTSEMYSAMTEFAESLFLNPETGRFQLKRTLFNDFREIYLPILMETVRYVPIPRIEISDPNYDMAFDNIILSLDNIVPNLIELQMSNDVQMSPRPELPNAYFLNVLTLNIYQIQADLRDVEFAINKKNFPQFNDMGAADILLGGNGLSIELELAIDPNLPHTTLIPITIRCVIDTLRINMHESQHDMIYKLLGATMTAAIKKRMSRALEDQIYSWVRRIDAQLTRVKRDRAMHKSAAGGGGLSQGTKLATRGR